MDLFIWRTFGWFGVMLDNKLPARFEMSFKDWGWLGFFIGVGSIRHRSVP